MAVGDSRSITPALSEAQKRRRVRSKLRNFLRRLGIKAVYSNFESFK
jgi:hypothetical protein